MLDLPNIEDSVRDGYEKLGVEDYYKENSLSYTNPHEMKINTIMNKFLNEYIKLDRDKSTFKSHRDFSSEKEISFKHF